MYRNALAALLIFALPLGLDAKTCVPKVERFVLQLPGSPSRAEIMRPPGGKPLAIMVLIHGSDVADLDNSNLVRGAVVSTPLRDVAVAVACGGIATVRYDKRFVSGPDKVDRPAFDKLSLSDLLADAGAALDAARSRPDLTSLPPLVFGWSEGTTVAAALAAARPEVRAVILQAPVIDGFASFLQAQFPRVGAPYMERYATNGSVDAAAISRAEAGPGGIIAQIYVHMFKGFAPGEKLNPLLDTNKDGLISIEGEALPVIKGWFADTPNGGLGMYATAVALPGVRAQLDKIHAPMLILQGLTDGNVGVPAARSLSGSTGVTVKLYPGLGHTLGTSPSPLEDGFAPIAAKPLQDMLVWTRSQVRHSRLP